MALARLARLAPLVRLHNLAPRISYNDSFQIRRCSTLATPNARRRLDKMISNSYNLNCANSLNTKIIEIKDDDSLFTKLSKRMARTGLTKQKLRNSGFLLYESVADVINYSAWFKEFKLDDTFLSWFIITELHIWMLMVRSMAIPENGEFLRNCMVEALWADTRIRVKKLGPTSSKIVNDQLQIYSEQFNAAIIGYDEGILSNDIVLAGAIWRRFFQMNCSDPIVVEKLVKYTREQISELDKISDKQFIMESKVNWVSIFGNKY